VPERAGRSGHSAAIVPGRDRNPWSLWSGSPSRSIGAGPVSEKPGEGARGAHVPTLIGRSGYAARRKAYAGAIKALIRDHLDRARQGEPLSDDPLNARESQVVKLIAEGHTSREIADLLVISERTIERHRENILQKLHMRDRVELTRYAIRRGLIEP
jgi:DNA-binding CsgD family transcriptional regulator